MRMFSNFFCFCVLALVGAVSTVLRADVMPQAPSASVRAGMSQLESQQASLSTHSEAIAQSRELLEESDSIVVDEGEASDELDPQTEEEDSDEEVDAESVDVQQDTLPQREPLPLTVAHDDDEAPEIEFLEGIIVRNTGPLHKGRYPFQLNRLDGKTRIALIDTKNLPIKRSLDDMVGKVVRFHGTVRRYNDTGEELVLHARLVQD